MSKLRVLAAVLLIAPSLAPLGQAASITVTEPARVTALAVSMNQTGELIGANASIEVRVADEGSGHVFMDTRPLSGTDMQGSARVASRVAAGVAGHSVGAFDFFYTVRSDTPIIQGPSAGAIMTLAASVALENANREPGEEPWRIREDVMATGTINPDGSIGPVGGILEKAEAARDAGASTFVVPADQANYTPRLPPEQAEHGEEPVDVASFCREELNITCRSARTVSELVEVATGRQLPQPELGEPPTTAVYADSLGPRTREVVDRAERVFDTWDRFNESDVPDQARETVRSSLESAAEGYREADRLWEEDQFYSAASQAFQSSIQERFARLMVQFYESGMDRSFLEEAVRHAGQDVREARQAAEEAEVTGLHTLYTVGAGQERVSDAEDRLDQAWERLNGTAPPSRAMLQTAWAFERARTVHWWLELSEPFGSGPPLPEETSTLADEFLNLANELIAYSRSVGGSQGAQQARDVLDRAQRDHDRGFHAAALVEAAEAQVLASLALEVREGQPSPEKVNATRQQAALAIQEARGLGVEPVLPVAMFEFAGTREDPTISVRFYRTANVLAGLSSVLTGTEDPSPSRFIDEASEDEEDHREPVGRITAFQPGVLGWAVVGMFATLAAITLGLAWARRDGDAG